MIGIPTEQSKQTSGVPFDTCLDQLAPQEGLRLRQAPYGPFPEFADEDDAPRKGFRSLIIDDGIDVPRCLAGKVHIKIPESIRRPKYADVLVELSKATGVSIVCEDFASHATSTALAEHRDLGEGKVALQVLDKLRDARPFSWLLSDKDKLLVGSASLHWRRSHHNLVPAETVDAVLAKADGDGVDIDDVAPLFGLRAQQIDDWFVNRRDLPGFAAIGYRQSMSIEYAPALWRLYASLGAEDKAECRSEAGLAVAELDPVWIIRLLSQARADHIAKLPVPAPDDDPVWAVASEPANMIKARLKLVQHAMEKRDSSPRKSLPKHWYSITLIGPAEGDRLPWSIGTRLDLNFPVFTPEREAELTKTATDGAE